MRLQSSTNASRDVGRTIAVWICLVFAILLPPLLLSLYSIRVATTEVRNVITAGNKAVAERTAELVRREMEENINLGRALALMPGFAAAVQQHNVPVVTHHLAGTTEAFPRIDRVFVTDVAGTLWADYPPAPETAGKNFADRDWYKGVSKRWEPYISEVYRRSAPPQPLVIAVALPVRDEQANVVGILVHQYKLESLNTWLEELSVGRNGFVFIVDHTGTVAANPTLDLQARVYDDYAVIDAVQDALRGEASIAEYDDPVDGHRMAACFVPADIGGKPWCVVASQHVEDAYAPIVSMKLRILFAGTLLIVGAMTATMIFGRTVEHNRRLGVQLQEKNRILEADIADRRNAEKRLREAEHFLTSMIENIPHMIFVKEAKELRFVRFNKAGQDLLGIPLENLIDKNDYDFFPKEQADFFTAKDREVLASGKLTDIPEEPIQTMNKGTRLLHTKKIPINDESGHPLYLLGVSEDITEQVEKEKVIENLHADVEQRAAALEAANKELEAFSYSVSHDLRAPLRAIDGFSKILTEDYGQTLDPEARRLLGVVRENTVNMGQLIDDLLAFSRLSRQPLAKSEVDMEELARGTLAHLRQQQDDRNIDVRIDKLPPAAGDASLLKQVYVNLLSNAIKFTRTRDPAKIEIGYSRENNIGIYFVRDNGVGFDMRYVGKLFGVFQRLHRAEDYEGTGVGLAIVQRIVQRHGGRIWAESKVNEGATFYFTLGAS